MCLILSNDDIGIANEDIICYKVMEKRNETLISPYQSMRYECGTTYVSETPITVKHISEIGPCVEEGFHSVSNEQEAERLKSVLQSFVMLYCSNVQYVVVKCLIPAGTRYAVGFFSWMDESFDSLCSERIIILEEV